MLLFAALCCILFSTASTRKISDNIAKGKEAYQSSTVVTIEQNSHHAVDGNRDSQYKHGSCTHTKVGDKKPWWAVDLQKTMVVQRVSIYIRKDCCRERLHDFYIEVLSSLDDKKPHLCKHRTKVLDKSADFKCNSPVKGRYVRIRKDKIKNPNDALSLCEVEVYTTAAASSKNVALGKPTFQSTQYYVIKNPASNAVDGIRNGALRFKSCASTKEGDKSPWWIVDLKKKVDLAEVTIYNRVDCCSERLHDFTIEMMSNLNDKAPKVCTHQIKPVGKSSTFKCNNISGRYLRIKKKKVTGATDVLTLCEVEVKVYI